MQSTGSTTPTTADLTYTVKLEWFGGDRIWLVTSPDIVGLILETRTFREGLEQTAIVAPELMEANRQELPA